MRKNFKDDRFLARWLNDELTEEELNTFKESQDYAIYQKLIAGAENIEPAKFDQEKIMAKIKRERDSIGARKSNDTFWMYGAAASILILLSFAIYSVFFGQTETVVLSDIGEKKKVTLPDGSEVILNANSSITYVEDSWDEERIVNLNGEAYFKVEKGIDFTVRSSSGSVSVLGTEFNVQDLKGFYEVICFEGKVSVDCEGEEEILKPKQGVRKREGDVFIRKEIEDEAPSWLNNRSSFHQVPIQSVLAALKNQYGIEFRGLDELKDVSYTGGFPHNDLESALRLVLGSLGLTYELKNGVVTIGG